MEASQESPERRVVSYEEERVVSLGRRGNKRESESDTSCYLHNESNQGGASKNVPPFGIMRSEMPHRLKQHADPNAIIEPKPDGSEELAHSVVEIGTTTDFICTSPFSTRTS